MKHEYKVGDKVKIREDLKAFYAYGGIIAVPEMLSASGKVITICGHPRQDVYGMSNGYCYLSEMFDQNYKPESEKYMKTSEFKAELEKMGYTFEGKFVNNENNLTMTWISALYVNDIYTSFGREISPKLFNLIYKYAATPIDEREDEKLFNVQIIKGNWGSMSWLYREYDGVNTSSSANNNDLNQQWTIEQIKEYGIDDETVYKRMPVEG